MISQEKSNQSAIVGNEEFLRTLAGEEWRRVPVASGDRSWSVRPAIKALASYGPDQSNYFCVSIFKAVPGGKFVRRKEQFERQFVFVIDDVGTKLIEKPLRDLLPDPTYVLETSPSNFQWGYKLDGDTDARMLAAVIDSIISDPVVNPSLKDPGMTGVTRVVRLPIGANNKEKVVAAHGAPFRHVLHEWRPAVSYALEYLAAALKVDVSEEALSSWSDGSARAGRATVEEIEADHILRLFDIKGMLIDATPNDNGFVTVRCPWAEEHSDAREEAGYMPGPRGFQCFHGHCVSRTMKDVRAWFAENATGEERAEALSETFGPVDPADPVLAVEEQRIERRIEVVRELQANWVYVRSMDRFGEVETNTLHTRAVFNSTMFDLAPAGAAGKKAASAVFLNGGGALVDLVDYSPGKPAVFARWNGPREETIFNLWRPGPVAPWPFGDVTDVDVKEWLDHVRFIFPDRVARELYLNWSAFQIQRPGEKVNWAFTLIGRQGVGKDLALLPITNIVGPRNVSSIRARDIDGQWTFWAESQIVVLEELPPFQKRDVYESLKAYVSTAQPYIIVNKKGVPQYWIRNIQNWFFFSNHADALALEPDDRRFFVYLTPALKRDPAYYARLGDAFNNPVFLSKLCGWLMQRDLSQFNPNAAPPWTDAKQAMVEAARDPAEQFIAEQFEEGGVFHGREIVRVNEVTSLATNSGTFGGELPPWIAQKVTPKKISATLRAHGWSPLKQRRTPALGKCVFWVTERLNLWEQMRGDLIEKRYIADLNASKSEQDDDRADARCDETDPF